MSLEFGGTGEEGVARGEVAACRQRGRAPHALDLVRRLHRAVVVQLIQQARRVGRRKPPVRELILPLANERDAPASQAEQILRGRRVAHDFHLEFREPRVAGEPGRPVPVVGGLVKAEQRLAART